MHHLSEIEIENFRSCIKCSVPLFRFTPIVGYNNGGKSNILESIKWLLRKWSLFDGDFCNPENPVVVTGTVRGVSEGVLARLEPKHRSRIEPLVLDNCLRIRRTQAKPGGGVAGIRLDVFDPTEEGSWRENPTGIDAAISALFPEPIHITAMEDAAEDVGKSKSTSTIGKLISELTGPLSDRHGSTIATALGEVRSILEADGESRAPELAEFDQQANEILSTLFPGIRVAVHIPPPEIVELFKSGTIRVFDGPDSPGREISSMGHGVQRSIQMALVRYLAERKARDGGSSTTTLLLIDEPELYLHPKAVEVVRNALESLSRTGYQVVFSTHSPQMVDRSCIADTLIIRKDQQLGTLALPTLRTAITTAIESAVHQSELLFGFQNSSQVLFADRVLLMEGKTERRLMPIICRLEGYSPPGDGSTALVSLGGSGDIPKALSVLNAMGLSAKAVVDLDFAFRAAIDLGWIDSDSEPVQVCRQILKNLEDEGQVDLAEDGYPKRSQLGSAEDGFALLAAQADAAAHIFALHSQLREHGVWVWQRGSFEHHLGIKGKHEPTWARFANELEEQGCEAVILDYQGMCELLRYAYPEEVAPGVA